MLEIKITICAPDLSDAITSLAKSIAGRNTASVPTEDSPEQKDNAKDCVPANTQAAPTAPTAPTGAAVKDGGENLQPSIIPTAAPQYTLDMIATAGSALIDAGKISQLMQLLSKFGVASLTELAPENYGAMAADLRALGASI